MAQTPLPKIKERVKVQILPSSDAKQSVELDYRLLVTGNYSRSEPGMHKDGDGTLKSRNIREIKSKKDFKTVMNELNPKLKIMVPNKLKEEEGSEIEVNIDVKDIKDFHPDEIVQKVEPLQKLMEARENLKHLKMQVLRDVKLKKAIENVLKDGSNSIDDLMNKLASVEESKE